MIGNYVLGATMRCCRDLLAEYGPQKVPQKTCHGILVPSFLDPLSHNYRQSGYGVWVE